MDFDTFHNIVMRCRRGESIEKIIEGTDIPRRRIVRLLNSYGVKFISDNIIQCIRDFNFGCSMYEISRVRRVPESTIEYWLSNIELVKSIDPKSKILFRKDRTPSLSESQLKKLKELRSKGKYTNREVARMVGCSVRQLELAVWKGLLPRIVAGSSSKYRDVKKILTDNEREMLGLKQPEPVSIRDRRS